MDEQAARRLAADINRNYFSIEKSPGRVVRHRAMAVVSRPVPYGDRDFGVRVSDEREDEFTLWDDADVNEAKSLARAYRGNRYRLFSAALAQLLFVVFASRAMPPPDVVPRLRARAVPYFYADEEILRLMDAAGELSPSFRGVTYHTLTGRDWHAPGRSHPSRLRGHRLEQRHPDYPLHQVRQVQAGPDPGDLAARFGPPPATSPRAGRSASAGPAPGVAVPPGDDPRSAGGPGTRAERSPRPLRECVTRSRNAGAERSARSASTI